MGKIMGIDFGDARVGVAISDEMQILASAHSVIEYKMESALINDLIRIINKENVEEIVIGLPINMNGTRGSSVQKVERFADAFRKRCGLNIHLFDERLSTIEAGKQIHASGKKTTKQNLDLVAATIILQTFIDARRARLNIQTDEYDN